jgi:hypothetical protein
MIVVKATKDTEVGKMPEEKLIGAMATYHEELAKAGVDVSGLQPTSKGWRVKYTGGKRTVIDGPFTETNPRVAGCFRRIRALPAKRRRISRSGFRGRTGSRQFAAGKNNTLAVSIPQTAVRRTIRAGIHPVPEHPAIERRAQQSQYKERSSCDS